MHVTPQLCSPLPSMANRNPSDAYAPCAARPVVVSLNQSATLDRERRGTSPAAQELLR
jgi:hypothetical protein